jgi:tetratricopeptide (TPR) repeat protein
VLLRSRGDGGEALTYLRRARDLYLDAGHILNRVRVLTDLGRTHLALREWGDANDAFDDADEFGADSPRHLAENALWRSWLAQTDGSKYRNFVVAAQTAKLAASASSISLRVEGLIALGYAKAEQNEMDTAHGHFTAALDEAKRSDAGKHRVNALLSLADFYSRYRPVERQLAVERLDAAREEMSRKGITSAYLRDKALRIATDIEKGDPRSMFVRSWTRVSLKGLRESERSFRNWAIRRALSETKGDLTKAAELLKMDVEALRQRVRRMRQTSPAVSSRPSAAAGRRR